MIFITGSDGGGIFIMKAKMAGKTILCRITKQLHNQAKPIIYQLESVLVQKCGYFL